MSLGDIEAIHRR